MENITLKLTTKNCICHDLHTCPAAPAKLTGHGKALGSIKNYRLSTPKWQACEVTFSKAGRVQHSISTQHAGSNQDSCEPTVTNMCWLIF